MARLLSLLVVAALGVACGVKGPPLPPEPPPQEAPRGPLPPAPPQPMDAGT